MRKLKIGWVGAALVALLTAGGVARGERAGKQETGKKKTAGASEQMGDQKREDAQSPERALRVLVPKIVSTWDSMDAEKIGRYYAADGTYFDVAPMKYKNWTEYAEGAKKGLFEPNSSLKTKVNDDLQVHAQGKWGWATFTFGVDIVSKQGASSHLDGRWTMILEKRAKGWIVVHEHVSVPMAGM